MLLVKILTPVILLLIFIQDIRSRAVYWFLFPLLTIVLLYIRFPLILLQWGQEVAINIGFLMLQLLMLTIYFSIKSKKWINITDQLLGLGDILCLISIAFYLSVLNFLFFYIISLLGTLLIWVIWQAISSKKNQYIPLAGFQSLIFMVFLAGDWWLGLVDLTNNAWLLHLIGK